MVVYIKSTMLPKTLSEVHSKITIKEVHKVRDYSSISSIKHMISRNEQCLSNSSSHYDRGYCEGKSYVLNELLEFLQKGSNSAQINVPIKPIVTYDEFKDQITELWSMLQQMDVSYEESMELNSFVVDLFLSSN